MLFVGDEDSFVLRTAEFLWQEGHTAHATSRSGRRIRENDECLC
jgi:hypothetical protein